MASSLKKKKSVEDSFLIVLNNDRWNYTQTSSKEKRDFAEKVPCQIILNQINEKAPSFDQSRILIKSIVFLNIFSYFIDTSFWIFCLIISLFLLLPIYIYLYYIDQKKIYIKYKINDEINALIDQLDKSFQILINCSSIWTIKGVEDTHEWKYNGGASQSVDKKKISIRKKLPSFIRSNIVPYSFKVNNQVFYFFPDRILIHNPKKSLSIHYSDLRLTEDYSNFIENWKAPADSTVIGHTWLHVNKDGSPDKRFKSNRKMPLVQYSDIRIKSPETTILLQCTKKEAGRYFVKEFSSITKNKQNFD